MAVQGIDRDVLIRKRIHVAFLVILACYLGLVGRLVFLQAMQGGSIHAEATHARERQITLHADLGAIDDRAGRPLAASLYTGTAGFDPHVLLEPETDTDRAKLVAKIEKGIPQVAPLLGLSADELATRIHAAEAAYATQKKRFYEIKNGVTLEQAQQLHGAIGKVPGLNIQDGRQRVYSSGPSAAQVVGCLDRNGTGQSGLERGCRAWLTGVNGFAKAEMDAQQREIPDTQQQIKPKRDGYDVHTTIDADAQRIAEEEAVKVYNRFQPKGVAVVVLEPTTGGILAMVSLPTFDANPLPTEPDRRRPIPDFALPDRCAGGLYEPGSTLKALTVGAAIDAGLIAPGTIFHCPPELRIGKRAIHEAHPMPRYDLDVESILRYSSNVGAAQIGLMLGGERLKAADARFGLFDPLGLPLPGAARGHWSLDRNEDEFSRAKAARAAFGQAVTTTPLHVALAYAAIANGGIRMQPYLVTSVTDSSGKIVKQWAPRPAGRAISARTADTLTGMLRDVVTEGTGTGAAIPGYQVAGKTGTASKYRKGAYVGSFAGFVPASPGVTPRLMILVAVDEPDSTKAYYGADVAAPAFQAIASRLLKLWRVQQDDPTSAQAHIAQPIERRKRGLPPLTIAHRPDMN